MFGIQSFGIWSVYLLCILSTVACVIYGAKNWNKGGDDESIPINKEKLWKEEEKEIEENF